MKNIIIVLIILLYVITANAENYVFFGKYFDSTLNAYQGSVNEFANYRAGIHVEEPLLDNFMITFAENETLMDSFNGGFTPASTNFKIGFWFDFIKFKIIAKHECKHPHENRPLGYAENYSLIEIRYNLAR